ncbi:hypothetical protein F-VV57_0126 [Faustovirus]|nr:hypothetical protein F-VV57_0126 [Faustovirus]QJX73393.1 hypothetical protein F-VV63_0127 [Faustovirus]
MSLNSPYIVDDVLKRIAELAPAEFLGVNKSCQKFTTYKLIAGEWRVPVRETRIYAILTRIVKNNTCEMLAGLMRAYKPTLGVLGALSKYALDSELYDKAETIAAHYNTQDNKRFQLLVADSAYALKYYELNGVADIVVDKSDQVLAKKWMVHIKAADFLPLVPMHLIDDIYKQHAAQIIANHNLFDRRLFKQSSTARIYKIWRHHPMIHYKLVLKLLRTDRAVIFVASLLNDGVIVSACYSPFDYIKLHTYMIRHHAEYPQMLDQIYTMMSNFEMDGEDERNAAFIREWRKYVVGPHGAVAAHKLMTCIINLCHEYSIATNYENKLIDPLLEWCVEANDLILAGYLLSLASTAKMYLGNTEEIYKHDSTQTSHSARHNYRRIRYLFELLCRVDVIILAPTYRQLYMAVVVIISDAMRYNSQAVAIIHEYRPRLRHIAAILVDQIFNYITLAGKSNIDNFNTFEEYLPLTHPNLASALDQRTRYFLFQFIKLNVIKIDRSKYNYLNDY